MPAIFAFLDLKRQHMIWDVYEDAAYPIFDRSRYAKRSAPVLAFWGIGDRSIAPYREPSQEAPVFCPICARRASPSRESRGKKVVRLVLHCLAPAERSHVFQGPALGVLPR